MEWQHLLENRLFIIAALLIVGFLISKTVTRIRLPEITGFIIAGLLLNESVTGLVTHEIGNQIAIITDVALGMIALIIGGEFSLSKLRRLGLKIFIITATQLLVTFGVVALSLNLFGNLNLPLALVMGAVASATAPAATVAIVQNLGAKGEFIDYLYGVVALDDAGAVILFGVSLAIAVGIENMPTAGGGAGLAVLEAAREVGLSLLVGAGGGVLIHLFAFRRSNQNEVLITTLGILLFTIAVSTVFHLSTLLVNMTAGAMLINLSQSNNRIFRVLQPLTPPIYALFFVIAGTELQPQILFSPTVLFLGGIYIFSRAIGKYGGVFSGALWARTSTAIRNNLGICMLPQAGVALGLIISLQESSLLSNTNPVMAAVVQNLVNVVLLSVFINELIGPPLSRLAIIKGTKENK